MAVADLNGDAKPDLAVANFASDSVSVLLGTGDGTFGAAANFATGDQPVSVAVADLNGDAKPDLAVANSAGRSVSVFLGTGTGAFGAATTVEIPGQGVAVVAADMNRDGKPDLVVATKNANRVSVFRGNGDGTFAPAQGFFTSPSHSPTSIAVADVNGDAIPDLALTETSNRLSVFWGHGDGTFANVVVLITGDCPISVAVGDLNGDARPDVAVANANSGNVSVFLGDGTGRFATAVNFGAGRAPFSVAVGDLNGDARPDLAAANYYSASVSVLVTNAVPLAAPDAYPTPEDTPLGAVAPGVLANDSDADDAALTAALASPPAHGTVTLNPDGSFSYMPLADYHGPDTFTYRALDAHGGESAPVAVTLTVEPVNDAPVALDDAAGTPAGVAVTVPVAANDTDGDPLTAAVTTPPTMGTATCSAGACTYTPAGGFTGTDTFTYRVSDSAGATDEASVTLSVSVPDVPAAAADTATTPEDTPASVAVTVNDVLGDQPTRVSLAEAPSHGTAACATATCTYTPAANYHGPDSFTYTLTDADGDTSTAEAKITVTAVNDPPTIAAPPQAVGVGDPLAPVAGTDPDGDRLTFVVDGTLPDGTSLNPDGTFTGTPRTPGITTVAIRACDPNGACALSDLRIDVRPQTDRLPGPPGTLPRTGRSPGPLTGAGATIAATGLLALAAARRVQRAKALSNG